MKFSSTPESATYSEITFLALLETVVAVSISLLLVKLLQSTDHIAIGALIAPFLLLRTEASTNTAFRIFDSWFPKVENLLGVIQGLHERFPRVPRSLTLLLVWLPLLCLLAVVIRIAATIAALVSSPRESLLAIPGNWLRIALATDHRHPPELLPGVETASDAPESLQHLKYEQLRSMLSETAGPFVQKLALFALYAPPFIYRFFLKSTSLVYFPLIWVSDVPLTAKNILTLPLERVRRWYAFAILVVMLSPLVISFHTPYTLTSQRDRAIFTYVLPLDRADLWHITRVVAVAVTIAVYVYARKVGEQAVFPERERRIMAGANRLRACCGLFTMAAFIILVLTL